MKTRHWWSRFERPRDALEDALWPRAMSAGRTMSTALTLLLFATSLTLDDLRIFRFSAAFVGAGLSIAVFAFTPPIFASKLVRKAMVDSPDTAKTWMENAILRRRAFLGLAVALLIVWLVFFSSGRTPRW